MIKKLFTLTLILALAIAVAYGGSAFACSSCGCQDGGSTAKAAKCEACDKSEDGTCAGCLAAKADAPAGDAPAGCEGCQMGSEMCASCPAAVKTAMDSPHHGMPPADLNVRVIELGKHMPMVYMAGTVGEDVFGLFISMFEEAEQQNLLSDDSRVGAIFPFAMETGWDENTVIYAGVNLPEGATPAEPLAVFEIPEGEYLRVEHYGAYENTKDTWMAAMEWAAGHGIEFGEGPAMEHYLTDPESTPEEELITEIYIPLKPGQAHMEGHPGYVAGDGGHGHDAGHGSEHPHGEMASHQG